MAKDAADVSDGELDWLPQPFPTMQFSISTTKSGHCSRQSHGSGLLTQTSYPWAAKMTPSPFGL